ncbi:hypothetical protein [Amycolatopsis regifaucium]|uniref:Uncharacterized protein n=1 Tax=Amycolatopsis regifaucium TaxID=546365 RepID=A0A154M6F9_9PSEU|nr:hypothetical protein [Amycolatopsis regifaucium]KZB80053.1 hypothetical protein AVL48_13545 [Amycolatopsis regifaucium]OKA09578.1 hypothetical protein ATP06_0209005 [Amycolatopsis regifaucium]SFH65619.1 hypothetical protein SAMN04489731_105417 [Amycolatopsis regifaucium]
MTPNRAPAPRHRSVFFLLILLVFAFVTPTVPPGHGVLGNKGFTQDDPVAVFATHPLPAFHGAQVVPLVDVPAETATADLSDAGPAPEPGESVLVTRALPHAAARAPPR